MKMLQIALCGNPNVGKSTVFNALTGLKQHTGNWAGKTVESAMGTVHDADNVWQLIDLPGAYSLMNGSPEEVVASDYLTFHPLDAVIVVCDATCLERNLNLALQIAQAHSKTILCINMLDEAQKRGITLDLSGLSQQLGVPVVGISARKKIGLTELKKQTLQIANAVSDDETVSILYPLPIENALEALELVIKEARIQTGTTLRFNAIRALLGDESFMEKLVSYAHKEAGQKVLEAVVRQRSFLTSAGYPPEKLTAALISASYRQAEELRRRFVQIPAYSAVHRRQLVLDRILCHKFIAIPLMVMLLAVILYLTLSGANIPSAWLNEKLTSFEEPLTQFLQQIKLPHWLNDMLVTGVYRVTSWVISVMLPPMAIFFPLFTLLEDLGLLPRVAFNMDRCFQSCRACGKQALCMCMGLGCNAVGVTGCRIIQSPRERLIAILTNALIPCNGRFPTLIAISTMFFVSSALSGAIVLALLIMASILMTLLCSWLLSKTVLKGVPSAFTLELPPFRRPQIGELLVRSVLDRTLFVLGRAISVAAPAGMLVWLLAHFQLQGMSLLQFLSVQLDPFGRMLGLDGVVVLAFMLGFPANEIVLPLMMMIYLDQSSLMELQGLEMLRELLLGNGWTLTTAICATLFALFHWPCSTTTLTIYKETKSFKWTLTAVFLPTLLGCALCACVSFCGQFF